MTAVLLLDQAGLPAGSSGFARTDGLLTAALVTVQSVGIAQTHEARLLTVPGLDTTSVASFVATGSDPPTWTFSPTVGIDGMYRVELVTDRGLASEDRQVRVFGIRNAGGLLFPSYGLLSDPLANVPDLSDAQKLLAFIQANELNEPTGAFPSGNPFGYQAELDAILRAGTSGGGSADVLMNWNGLDFSQFEASPVRYLDDLGGGSGADPTLGLGTPFKGSPTIRISCVSFRGGAQFFVLASELPSPMPRRYIVELEISLISLAGIRQDHLLFGADFAGTFRGATISRSSGNANLDLAMIRNDLQNISTSTGAGVGTWDTGQEEDGGTRLRCEVIRQNGQPTSDWLVATDAKSSDNTAVGAAIRNETDVATADWNTFDLDRVGIGIFSSTSARTGHIELTGFRIRKHPEDLAAA